MKKIETLSSQFAFKIIGNIEETSKAEFDKILRNIQAESREFVSFMKKCVFGFAAVVFSGFPAS